jgi:hypothetical protein
VSVADVSPFETWDRSPDDRGTLFGAASGMIVRMCACK